MFTESLTARPELENDQDPILTQLGPGSAVPHGTAEAGGFGLSVTELGKRNGVVVYWLQMPGGVVFVREPETYTEHEFKGPPRNSLEQNRGFRDWCAWVAR